MYSSEQMDDPAYRLRLLVGARHAVGHGAIGQASSPAGHHKYIDPLVAAADFGIHY